MNHENRISIMEIKIDNLEEGFKDHERRMRHNEKYIYLAIGALAVLEIVLKFIE